MKVLMVSPPAETVLRGGLWQQVEHTAEALCTLGVDVVFFQPHEGSRVHEFDLCHVIGANIGSYQLARELHRRGIPLVVSPVFFSRHSSTFVHRALRVQRFLSKFALGIWIDYRFVADMCHWAKHVLPNTQEEAEFVHRAFDVPQEKMTIVPNAVEDKFYSANPELFQQKYGMKNFVLYVGHFAARGKNVLRLIRVLNRLDVPAVIIGEGKDQSYVEACRREAAKNKKLLMIGALPNDSDLLASAYAACGVFVLPSDYETPGIASLEAALAGAKIVITKYGGTRDYFGEWAEYVDPTSEESILNGIRSALAKPRTSELREHIKKYFLWKNVGEKTLEVYKHVLREKGEPT